MARTLGAKDKKKRKEHKDRKYKYHKKHGRLVPYITKRGRNDPLKLQIWEVRNMSPEGLSHWNKHIRPKVHKKVYVPTIRIDVPPERLATKELIAQLILDVMGHEGTFLIMGYSHSKTPYHVKPVALCKVVVNDTPDGLHAKLVENRRLWRYWFWRDR